MDRSYSVRLKADVDGYLSGIKSAGNATRQFAREAGQSAKAHKADWQQVGQAVTVAGLAIAAGVGLAIARFADFDQAMSGASAATNATAGDLDKLREAAINAGADTQYSATEAAGAITELGKAGVSTADILEGGLAGALNLAAAGQMDVAAAAEVAAVTLKQFKLEGQDIGHVADLLAAGAGKAVGSVADLGMALKQSGQVAAQTGLSVDETTAALSAFAASGLIGSDAGTSFKSMLQRLTPQSKEAKAEMEKLGISAYDASGNFVGLEKFSGNLKSSLSGLTVEQRNSAMATIFGSDAVRAAAVLYDQGAEGVAAWTASVNDAGFAQRQAARLTDNWRGDLERLGGSLDSALIKGGSGANQALRGITQSLEGVVDWFGRLPGPVQSSAVTFGAVAAAALLVGGAVLTAVPKVQALKVSLDAMTASSTRASVALGVLGKAAAVIALAAVATTVADIGAAAQVAHPETARLANGLREIAAGAEKSADFGSVMAIGMGFFRNDAEKTTFALDQFAITAKKALDPGIFDAFSGAGGAFAEQAGQIDAALASLVESGSAAEAEAAFGRIAEAARAQGVDVTVLAKSFPAYQAALDGVTAAGESLIPVQQTSAQVVDEYFQAAKNAARATSEYADALNEVASPILTATAAVRDWEQAVDDADDALKKNGKTLDVSTEKGRANGAALDKMAKSAIDNAGAMAANGASQADLQKTLDTSRARIEAQAVKFGMSKDAARAYADQLLKVPPTVATTIVANTSQAYQNVANFKSLYDSLRDKSLTIRQTTIVKQSLAHSVDLTMNQAAGGYISGPGTGTSDSIPARLSNGEYVVRAAAVDRYGVDMLHAINSMRFASGGLVGQGPQAPAAQSLTLPSEGWAISGSLSVGGALVPLIDGRIARLGDMASSGRRAY